MTMTDFDFQAATLAETADHFRDVGVDSGLDYDDPLEHAGAQVINFGSRFLNDPNRARHGMETQVAEMLMRNVRELHQSGAWRHYRHGLGEFVWLEHEFDYFLASCMIHPAEYARIIKRGSIPLWAELVNSTNPGRGQRGQTRRPIEDVADQIRRGVPGGYGDPDHWVHLAREGFADRNEMAIARDARKVRKAAKAGSVSAVARPEQVRIQLAQKRDAAVSVEQQQADMLAAWLKANPAVARLLRKTP
jgi:hypothetical protein